LMIASIFFILAPVGQTSLGMFPKHFVQVNSWFNLPKPWSEMRSAPGPISPF
jgi:dipeptide/tripeptide permease